MYVFIHCYILIMTCSVILFVLFISFHLRLMYRLWRYCSQSKTHPWASHTHTFYWLNTSLVLSESFQRLPNGMNYSWCFGSFQRFHCVSSHEYRRKRGGKVHVCVVSKGQAIDLWMSLMVHGRQVSMSWLFMLDQWLFLLPANNPPIGSIYHLYIAFWGVICYLPPFTGTRNNHWLDWEHQACHVPKIHAFMLQDVP